MSKYYLLKINEEYGGYDLNIESEKIQDIEKTVKFYSLAELKKDLD